MQKRDILYHRHLAKATATRNIEELAHAFKIFLNEQYDIPHGHTFTEIQTTIDKKHIHPHLKEHIKNAAKLFEEMEYRPKKLLPHELKHLKGHVHNVIHKSREAYTTPKKEKHSILHHMRNARDKLMQMGKRKKGKFEDDPEYKEMEKFLHASKSLKIPKERVREELLMMGFSKEKVDALLN